MALLVPKAYQSKLIFCCIFFERISSFQEPFFKFSLNRELDLPKEVKNITEIQHGRYLETWYLEAGRDLGTTEADTEVGVL